MTSTTVNIAIDVGNSAIKVACGCVGVDQAGVDQTDTVTQHSFSLADSRDHPPFVLSRISKWIRAELVNAGHIAEPYLIQWWVATVNRSVSDPLREHLIEAFDESVWHDVGWKEVPIGVQVEYPDRLGIDRLLGAHAASRRYDQPLVVVDAGSAVTVDWVSRDDTGQSCFRGGAILPGVRLQRSALAMGTEQLSDQPSDRLVDSVPQVPVKTDLGSRRALMPAKNTADAIGLGVVAAIAGGIERLVSDYQLSMQSDIPMVVVTGGDGAAIAAFLKVPHVLVPNLVCFGLMDLASDRCPESQSGLE